MFLFSVPNVKYVSACWFSRANSICMTNLLRFLSITIDLLCFCNKYLSFWIYCVLYIVFVYILYCVSLCFLWHRSVGSSWEAVRTFEYYSTDRLQGVCFVCPIFRAAGPKWFKGRHIEGWYWLKLSFMYLNKIYLRVKYSVINWCQLYGGQMYQSLIECNSSD